MSASSTATVNRHLTNYAQGIAQDMARRLANFIAPIVPTGASSGQYAKFDDKNAFQVYATLRALGGPNTRIQFAKTDPYFNCQPRGLAIAVDDEERNKAGDWQQQLEEAKVKTLVSTTLLGHENDVLAAVLAGLTAVAGKGVWSDAGVDPVGQIDEQIEAIATETGLMPNKIVFGVGAWRVFRNHTLVKARQPGAELIGLTTEQAARMMLNPGIRIEVGMLSKDTTKFGATKNATNIVGAECLIFNSDDTPTQYDPSFAKTFTPTATAFDSVLKFRDEDNNSDVFKTNWSDDIKVVSTALARRITLS